MLLSTTTEVIKREVTGTLSRMVGKNIIIWLIISVWWLIKALFCQPIKAVRNGSQYFPTLFLTRFEIFHDFQEFRKFTFWFVSKEIQLFSSVKMLLLAMMATWIQLDVWLWLCSGFLTSKITSTIMWRSDRAFVTGGSTIICRVISTHLYRPSKIIEPVMVWTIFTKFERN